MVSCPMATQKPISTISYNTESFLREKLESWYSAHIIQAYQYICHKGEDGDKDHIHLRIEPNKKLDPMVLAEELQEYQFGKDKPLGCRTFRPSKEEDWLLYAVHDPDYLALKYNGGDKGEKIPYEWEDIKCPESYDMEVAFIRAKAQMKHTTQNIATRIRAGADPLKLVLEGDSPFMVNAVMHLLADTDYRSLLKDYSELRDEVSRLNDAIMNAGYEAIEDISSDGERRYFLIPLELCTAQEPDEVGGAPFGAGSLLRQAQEQDQGND